MITALLFAGRAGTALASELGLMRATDQLSAMEMMAVDPIRRVVVPRFLGGVIAMPLLAAIFSVIGIYGAQLVGVQLMGVDSGSFWSQMRAGVELRDVNEGIVKSCMFGIACSLIAVYEGYYAMPTAEGVGPGDHAHGGHLGRRHFVLGLSADVSVFVLEDIPMRSSSTLNLGTGTFVLLGFAALAFLTTQTTSRGLHFASPPHYTLTAKFDNIGDLKVGAPVSMSGVEIGRVSRIDLDRKEFKAVVTMSLLTKYNQIPIDSDASIYTQGLLGGKYHRPDCRRLRHLSKEPRSDRLHAVGVRARESDRSNAREFYEESRPGRNAAPAEKTK